MGVKTIDYTYDRNGNAREVTYQKGVTAERFTHYYTYDPDQRLTQVHTSRNGSTKSLQAKYSYYLHGPVKRVELAENLQGVDYVYTIQGWLKSINHAGADTNKDPGKDGVSGATNRAFAPDAFGLQLDYFSGDYTRSNTNIATLNGASNALYSGQIQTQSWFTKKPQSVISTQGAQINNPVAYTYAYDERYQLQEAIFGTPDFTTLAVTKSEAFKEYGFQYDLHGNIISLKRNNAAGTLTDNFTYQYDKPNTNQLTGVVGYGKTYSYNAIGQMTSAVSAVAGELTQYLEYNVRGLVTKVYADAAKTQLKVSYFYDEGSRRVKKINHTTNIATYYVYHTGGEIAAIYDNENAAAQTLKEVSVYGSGRLGTYFTASQSYTYELKNQTGNVLAIISRTKLTDGTVDVLSYTDYYPFGHEFRSGGSLNYRYGYQGEFAEKDQETGWHNFELRQYDSRIARWMSPDPYDQYWSPYVGMGNDPVNGIDPDGGFKVPPINPISSVGITTTTVTSIATPVSVYTSIFARTSTVLSEVVVVASRVVPAAVAIGTTAYLINKFFNKESENPGLEYGGAQSMGGGGSGGSWEKGDDDDLIEVYHYTDKKGYDGIRSGNPHHFKKSKPDKGNPEGVYVTTMSPEELRKKPGGFKSFVGVTGEKQDYYFKFKVKKSKLRYLNGGRTHVQYSPESLNIPREHMIKFGETPVKLKKW